MVVVGLSVTHSHHEGQWLYYLPAYTLGSECSYCWSHYGYNDWVRRTVQGNFYVSYLILDFVEFNDSRSKTWCYFLGVCPSHVITVSRLHTLSGKQFTVCLLISIYSLLYKAIYVEFYYVTPCSSGQCTVSRLLHSVHH